MDIQIFVQNVKSILDERGISYSKAGRESGAGEDFIRNIDRKGSFPSIDKVKKMAEYLGVTTSELLGEKETPTPADGSGRTPEFVQLYERLNEAEQVMIMKQIRGLLSQEWK